MPLPPPTAPTITIVRGRRHTGPRDSTDVLFAPLSDEVEWFSRALCRLVPDRTHDTRNLPVAFTQSWPFESDASASQRIPWMWTP